MAIAPNDPKQAGRDRSDGDAPSNGAIGSDARRANADAADATGYDFLALVSMCEERDLIFKGTIQKARWRKAYDAYHNRHPADSKYSDPVWRRKRTSIFRPKTRASVRKSMAAAAASLFTTSDVVQVQAESNTDPKRAASAAILKEVLGYRLDRTSGNAGMPWFMVAMGAHLDSQITAICYTKQFWEYERVTEKSTTVVQLEHFYPDTGDPVLDDATGEPVTSTESKDVEESFVTKDRPWSMNIPADNVMIDPAAYWINAVQSSGYLILRMPMPFEMARQMLKNPGKANVQWLDVSDELLRTATDDYTSKGVRTARAADRQDPFENRSSGDANGRTRNEIVWLYECFMRVDGVDYNFWTLGSRYYASKIKTTRQSYPEQRGERPVVRGYAAIETHETFPMSPVESWQEMQRELNDIVNLRLDTMKQALSPIAKVKQGSTFDFKQLHNRAGQDTTIIVRNMEDLEFDRSPDATSASYQETNLLNADFDDLAGVFSGSSVNTNRNLNETVGGMQLLSGSANAVTEYDLRVWIETWAEPTLRQIVRLEQYYENDETVLAIAGDRANLFERFGIDQISDKDLERDVTVRVDVGLGSADPMARLTKLRLGLATLAPMLPFMDKKVQIKADEIIKEIMGAIGFNDGMRFVELVDQPQGGQDPAAAAEQIKAQMAAMNTASQERIATGDRESAQSLEQIKQQGALLQLILKQLTDVQKHQQQLAQADQHHKSSMLAGLVTTGARNASAASVAAQRAKQQQRPAAK